MTAPPLAGCAVLGVGTAKIAPPALPTGLLLPWLPSAPEIVLRLVLLAPAPAACGVDVIVGALPPPSHRREKTQRNLGRSANRNRERR